MVASVSVRVSQGDTAVVSFAGDSNVLASQSDVVAVFNIPAEVVQASQADLAFISLLTSEVEVSQADVIFIARGRTENVTLRVWTFTLDGHDFYVLRLGDQLTLVYDNYSEQWVDWQSSQLPFWRANCGINWTGGEALAAVYNSNVVVGDDNVGILWFLDPEQPYDQSPNEAAAQQEIYFQRVTMGQVAMKGRGVMPCYAAWLTTDMGAPAYDGAGVTLEISDDAGQTFDDMGMVTVTLGVHSPEISWYSLGQIAAPGRLFRITDDGAVARIDGLEMNDPDDAG